MQDNYRTLRIDEDDAAMIVQALQESANNLYREAKSRRWIGPQFKHVRAKCRAEAAERRALIEREFPDLA